MTNKIYEVPNRRTLAPSKMNIKLRKKKLDGHWAQEVPNMIKNNTKARSLKLKAIQYLGGKCIKCNGEFLACVYDFHHRDPKTKDYNVSQMLANSWEEVKKELNKCELLCANCHRIHHYMHGNK